jgi:IrrE N-terminal-like domain
MRRGFKTWAEQQSITARRLCGLPNNSPLKALDLAQKIGVQVVTPREIAGFPPDLAEALLGHFGNLWSAATIPVGDTHIIVYNSAHAPSRQESDLMHELTHIWCKHQPASLRELKGLGLFMRGYNAEHEEEAEWLGACLQIPRTALLDLIRNGMADEAICALFGCSQQMLRFRRSTTGIDQQITRGRRKGIRTFPRHSTIPRLR